MPRYAVVLGASGLTGSLLVQELNKLDVYDNVYCLVREKTSHKLSKIQEIIVDFQDISPVLETLPQISDLYVCIGSTGKKTPQIEDYYDIDLGIPVRTASLLLQKGLQKCMLISAMGADRKSSVPYNKLKGDVEFALKELSIPTLYCLRPSLLLGPRKEIRWGERIGIVLAKIINPLLFGPLAKWKAIESHDVALAMIYLALEDKKMGAQIFMSDQIKNLARQFKSLYL